MKSISSLLILLSLSACSDSKIEVKIINNSKQIINHVEVSFEGKNKNSLNDIEASGSTTIQADPPAGESSLSLQYEVGGKTYKSSCGYIESGYSGIIIFTIDTLLQTQCDDKGLNIGSY